MLLPKQHQVVMLNVSWHPKVDRVVRLPDVLTFAHKRHLADIDFEWSAGGQLVLEVCLCDHLENSIMEGFLRSTLMIFSRLM